MYSTLYEIFADTSIVNREKLRIGVVIYKNKKLIKKAYHIINNTPGKNQERQGVYFVKDYYKRLYTGKIVVYNDFTGCLNIPDVNLVSRADYRLLAADQLSRSKTASTVLFIRNGLYFHYSNGKYRLFEIKNYRSRLLYETKCGDTQKYNSLKVVFSKIDFRSKLIYTSLKSIVGLCNLMNPHDHSSIRLL